MLKKFENSNAAILRGGTVSRTFRIPRSAAELFAREARRREVSINSLVNSVLKGYVEGGRFSDRLHMVSLNSAVLEYFLEKWDEAQLAKLGKGLGEKINVDNMKIMGLQLSKEACMSYVVNFLGDTANWFEHESYDEGRTGKLVLHHRFGRRWAVFLQNFLQGCLDSTGTLGEVRLTENVLEIIVDGPVGWHKQT